MSDGDWAATGPPLFHYHPPPLSLDRRRLLKPYPLRPADCSDLTEREVAHAPSLCFIRYFQDRVCAVVRTQNGASWEAEVLDLVRRHFPHSDPSRPSPSNPLNVLDHYRHWASNASLPSLPIEPVRVALYLLSYPPSSPPPVEVVSSLEAVRHLTAHLFERSGFWETAFNDLCDAPLLVSAHAELYKQRPPSGEPARAIYKKVESCGRRSHGDSSPNQSQPLPAPRTFSLHEETWNFSSPSGVETRQGSCAGRKRPLENARSDRKGKRRAGPTGRRGPQTFDFENAQSFSLLVKNRQLVIDTIRATQDGTPALFSATDILDAALRSHPLFLRFLDIANLYYTFCQLASSPPLPSWPLEPVRIALWLASADPPYSRAQRRHYVDGLETLRKETADLFKGGGFWTHGQKSLWAHPVIRSLCGQPPEGVDIHATALTEVSSGTKEWHFARKVWLQAATEGVLPLAPWHEDEKPKAELHSYVHNEREQRSPSTPDHGVTGTASLPEYQDAFLSTSPEGASYHLSAARTSFHVSPPPSTEFKPLAPPPFGPTQHPTSTPELFSGSLTSCPIHTNTPILPPIKSPTSTGLLTRLIPYAEIVARAHSSSGSSSPSWVPPSSARLSLSSYKIAG